MEENDIKLGKPTIFDENPLLHVKKTMFFRNLATTFFYNILNNSAILEVRFQTQ